MFTKILKVVQYTFTILTFVFEVLFKVALSFIYYPLLIIIALIRPAFGNRYNMETVKMNYLEEFTEFTMTNSVYKAYNIHFASYK